MSTVARSSRPAKRAKLANDVRPMMYGFGDSIQPLDESVDLVEDIVIDFLTNLVLRLFLCPLNSAVNFFDLMCLQTQQAVEHNGGEPSKLRVEDMLFTIRKDRPKCAVFCFSADFENCLFNSDLFFFFRQSSS